MRFLPGVSCGHYSATQQAQQSSCIRFTGRLQNLAIQLSGAYKTTQLYIQTQDVWWYIYYLLPKPSSFFLVNMPDWVIGMRSMLVSHDFFRSSHKSSKISSFDPDDGVGQTQPVKISQHNSRISWRNLGTILADWFRCVFCFRLFSWKYMTIWPSQVNQRADWGRYRSFTV